MKLSNQIKPIGDLKAHAAEIVQSASYEDELKPEYDLSSLRVRKLGSARKSFGPSIVRVESDVSDVFPDAQSVNEALRFLIRVTKENRPANPAH